MAKALSLELQKNIPPGMEVFLAKSKMGLHSEICYPSTSLAGIRPRNTPHKVLRTVNRCGSILKQCGAALIVVNHTRAGRERHGQPATYQPAKAAAEKKPALVARAGLLMTAFIQQASA